MCVPDPLNDPLQVNRVLETHNAGAAAGPTPPDEGVQLIMGSNTMATPECIAAQVLFPLFPDASDAHSAHT